MGKKKSSSNSSNSSSTDTSKYPFVSVCTPTFNRRPFWPMAIKCFEEYDYPKDRMEWIIVDDGSDKIEDLVKDIPQVKYYKHDHQMVLGRKRNFMHDKSKGDIIVYQDDDDYYPPTRISHAVERLMSDPKCIAGGSTVLYLYFKHIKQMYRFGPYGPNHATAGTFAFKRKLLSMSRYDDHAALAEEKSFLQNYTIPFVQFDPLHTIMVFSHEHNTFDKRELLQYAPNPTCNPDMGIQVETMVKNKEIYDFFMNDIDAALAAYEPGEQKNKPEVINQLNSIRANRAKQIEEMNEIRKKTLENDDVKHVMAEARGEMDRMAVQVNAIREVNRRLVIKMKEVNKFVTGLIDDDTMKEIERVSKEPPPLNIKVLSANFNVIQDDSRKGIDVQNLNTIMSFITRNKLEMKFQINDDPTEHPFTQENIPLGFTPHPDEQGKWQSVQQGATLQNTVQNVQLGAVGNDEDVVTIMEQTQCNKATAINALNGCGGDVISAIMNIDEYKVDESSVVTKSSNVDSEDIQTVIEQSGCNEEIAKKALSLCDNDVIAAIMKIASGELSASDEPASSENVTMEVSA